MSAHPRTLPRLLDDLETTTAGLRGGTDSAAIRPRRARDLHRAHAADACWGLAEARGRLVELAGAAEGVALTFALELLHEAQQAEEPCAWVTASPALFSAEDAASNGLDLRAVVIVRVSNIFAVARAAERLLRSGAFGAVVLDLGAGSGIPPSLLGKLVKLAQLHDAAVVALTQGERGALGSLVSLRARTERRHVGDGQYRCALVALKDKRRGPGWQTEALYDGPPGLR